MNKSFTIIPALLLVIAVLFAQESPTVTLGTVVSTNNIVGVRRRIVVDFPDSGPPVTTVLYVVRRMDGSTIVSERALEPVVIEWPALTNRYPEVNAVLPRMNTDMAARLADQMP